MDHDTLMNQGGHMDHSAHMSHSMGDMMMDHPMNHTAMNHSSMGSMARDSMGHDMHNMQGMGAMSAMDHMMAMTFHGGVSEVILFDWWKTTQIGGFIGSFIAIFIMALAYEGLKYYRKHLLWNTYKGLQYCAVAPPDRGVANVCASDDAQIVQPLGSMVERQSPRMLSRTHAYQTFLHGLQVFVSYLLMLIFMTFNSWLCLAVVLGSATGYFLFGWRESVIVDFTEHCH